MLSMSVPWWELILRALIVYVFLIVLLRVTGKRQVGQLAPFDLVLLLMLSNAVQDSINGGDNSLLGGLVSATALVDHQRHRELGDLAEQTVRDADRGASANPHPQRASVRGRDGLGASDAPRAARGPAAIGLYLR